MRCSRLGFHYSDRAFDSCGFLACCIAQLIFCFEGSHVVIGVHTSALDGSNYQQQQAALTNMDGTKMSALIASKQAFVCKLSKRAAAVLPDWLHLSSTHV